MRAASFLPLQATTGTLATKTPSIFGSGCSGIMALCGGTGGARSCFHSLHIERWPSVIVIRMMWLVRVWLWQFVGSVYLCFACVDVDHLCYAPNVVLVECVYCACVLLVVDHGYFSAHVPIQSPVSMGSVFVSMISSCNVMVSRTFGG